jgi:hypothetical protein
MEHIHLSRSKKLQCGEVNSTDWTNSFSKIMVPSNLLPFHTIKEPQKHYLMKGKIIYSNVVDKTA